MKRKLLIDIHLILAAFTAPIVILIALSGVFYLLDIKGSEEETIVYTGTDHVVNFNADDRSAEMSQLLQKLNLELAFETVRGNRSTLLTRPTSTDYIVVRSKPDNVIEVTLVKPNFIAAIIELHKGHGPQLFRWLQIATGIALLFIVLSGLWLGLSSPVLKTRSMQLLISGSVILVLLAWVL